MTCVEIRPLLHAFADGELDLLHGLEVQKHLKSCAGCVAEKDSIESLRNALRSNDLIYGVPAGLQKEIRKKLFTSEPGRSRENPWLWKMLAAGATAFAILTICLRPAGLSEREQFLGEAVGSHIRSLQAAHLTDVVSSDQHTVKPWFAGKLDFAPPVSDFAEQGFSLVGGRLDYLEGRTVAALVYRHNKHFINVFIWPSENAAENSVENYHGYSVINLNAHGFQYCIVSDAEEKELANLAELLRR
jgi:anti-sigma factor RsiW